MDPSELRINIVYIPGTVPYLSCFPFSLVEWSDKCRFRLVSNGCSAYEENILSRMAYSDERLEFLSLQSERVLSHGEALTILQRQEKARYFTFLDSDVFATGEFLSDLIQSLASADAVFSSPSTFGGTGKKLKCLPGKCGIRGSTAHWPEASAWELPTLQPIATKC